MQAHARHVLAMYAHAAHAPALYMHIRHAHVMHAYAIHLSFCVRLNSDMPTFAIGSKPV
jgi:hypothetical protein